MLDKLRRRGKFSTSANYWEDRYRRGGHSGAGSYHRLAELKARVLNEFVATHAIQTVVEFGSGDGAQLALAKYPDYVGVDVSTTALDMTRRTFAGDASKRFLHTSEVDDDLRADLALSLDVIYHLVEDEVFDAYMHQLFDSATKYVIVYASNEDKPRTDRHVRHRNFTGWMERNQPDFEFVEKVPNDYPSSDRNPRNASFADFYVFARSGS